MSRIMDIPSKSVEYMLKGWVRNLGATAGLQAIVPEELTRSWLVLLRNLQIVLVHLAISHDCGRQTQDNLPNCFALLATLIE